MTIIVRHNEALELNLVEYRDTISMAELKSLAAYGAAHADMLRRDGLNLVPPGAVFSDDVDPRALDALFSLYRDLYATLEFQMVRRSAWICQSPQAAPLVSHWLGGDAREGMSSAVRQFETFAEAGEWLVLNQTETQAIEHAKGFVEVKRFGGAPALAIGMRA